MPLPRGVLLEQALKLGYDPPEYYGLASVVHLLPLTGQRNPDTLKSISHTLKGHYLSPKQR